MSRITIECAVSFSNGRQGRKRLEAGPQPEVTVSAGRVPRIARLMALAIQIEGLIRDGLIRDYAEAARLGHVTRARMSQIMNLLQLAPDIQEALLDLPLVTRGRDPVDEHDLRPIAAQPDWVRQRRMWTAVAQGQSN